MECFEHTGSLRMDNSWFKSAFANINCSIINANASISSLFQCNSDVTAINSSEPVVNLSLNFWKLSTTAWALTSLPAALLNLSTSYWIANASLTQNINTLMSVSTVAYNAWNTV